MNHEGLEESIDFESDSINLYLDATLNNEIGSYDECRDLTDDMLQTNKKNHYFPESNSTEIAPKYFK
jgi:hypothetical protein